MMRSDVRPLPIDTPSNGSLSTGSEIKYPAWQGGIENYRIYFAMVMYVSADEGKLNGVLGKRDASGTFFLHLTDAFDRSVYLPIARASWHVNHVDDGHWIPYRPEESSEIVPILQ